jgi:serine/threonine protein kinase
VDNSNVTEGVAEGNELDASDLLVGQVIGAGTHKTVRLGRIKNKMVALLEFRDGGLAAEYSLSADWHHPNIVESLGVITTGKIDDPSSQTSSDPAVAQGTTPKKKCTQFLVTEFAQFGSLDRIIDECRGKLSLEVKLAIIDQVTAGAQYLVSQGYIHRDLSARNVLVFNLHPTIPEACRVKIADFGLTCKINAIPKAMQDMPVRWMAPECLKGENKWSEKSDVWALGVCAWEVLQESSVPWGDISEDAKVTQNVCNKKHLEISANWPKQTQKMLKSCWCYDPTQRPMLADLKGGWELRPQPPSCFSAFFSCCAPHAQGINQGVPRSRTVPASGVRPGSNAGVRDMLEAMGFAREQVQLALEHLVANNEVVDMEHLIDALNSLAAIHAEGQQVATDIVSRDSAGTAAAEGAV